MSDVVEVNGEGVILFEMLFVMMMKLLRPKNGTGASKWGILITTT